MISEALVPGVMVLILLASAALTAPLSFFLLWLYRRAVLRGMKAAVGVKEAALPPPAAAAPPGHPLRITKISGGPRPVTAESKRQIGQTVTRSLVIRSLRRVMLAYVAAGLAFAAVFAGAWTAQAGEGFLPVRFLVMTVDLSWPIVLALSQLAALGWRDRLRFVLIYLGVFAAATVAGLWGSRTPDPLSLIMLWLIANGEGTLLLLAFLTRRIRSVGPLVLTFMIAGVTGSLLLINTLMGSPAATSGLIDILAPLGLGGVEIFVLVLLAGFVVLSIAGWGLLRLLGRSYQQKRMSDQALTLDAMWLLFALSYALTLASYNWRWLVSGLVAFGAYKLVLWAGLIWLVKPVAAGRQPPTLLLLRVFSLGSRSLHLFDALARHWLRGGPIALIAGPDLMTGLVEPPEFLDFMGGRVSRRFVQGRTDLEQRLAEFDARPDPDGRYRTNEFFCRADTWQMTMHQLAARSDAVLMDLRSFSPSNQGCLYELGELLNHVSLPQVLLLVDATTDQAFLQERLQSLWSRVAADSPNRALRDPEVRLYELRSGTGAEVRALLNLLYGQLRASQEDAA